MNDGEITRFLHSRYGYLLMALIAVAATFHAFSLGSFLNSTSTQGILGITPANDWLAPGTARPLCGTLLTLVISAMLVIVNSRYNIIRGLSMLYAGIFLIFSAAVPSLSCNINSGSFMALAWVLTLIPLFSAYQRQLATRRIFLTICTATAATLIFMPPLAIIYIPIYIAGCVQMRCLNLKTALAAIIGIVTPIWIIWGFGLTDVQTSSFALNNLFSPLKFATPALNATVLTTIALGGIFALFNLIKIYNYNGRARAYNGFITITAVATILLLLIDSANTLAYLPLLNVCAAIQAGHFFSINNRRRSYVPILIIIAIYIALYVWNIV
ncbi:MAG: hypothetical protein NC343_00645 [Muribaculum sp.]|nr:hypothetical protein [Muribaculaceae bacterium]MCM1080243.1 hypothetical protein [Muribaculum sp.]